jgi:hypothetical protein
MAFGCRSARVRPSCRRKPGFLKETGSEPCKRVLQNAADSPIGLGMFVFSMRKSFQTQPALFALAELSDHPAMKSLYGLGALIDWGAIEVFSARRGESGHGGPWAAWISGADAVSCAVVGPDLPPFRPVIGQSGDARSGVSALLPHRIGPIRAGCRDAGQVRADLAARKLIGSKGQGGSLALERVC